MKKNIFKMTVMLVFLSSMCTVTQAKESTLPLVGSSLSAEQTVALISFEQIDRLIQELLKSLHTQPKELQAHLPSVLTNLEQWKKTFGFDPTTSTGWSSLGIDSTAGLSVIFYAQTSRAHSITPIVLLKVTDEARLIAMIKRWTGQSLKLKPDQGNLRTFKVGPQSVWVARRGEYTALTINIKPSFKTDLIAFAQGGGTQLSEMKDFQDVFRGATSPSLFTGYLSTRKLAPLAKTLRSFKKKGVELDFYTERFPAVALSFDHKKTHIKVLASDQGLKALQQIFQPKRPATLTRYLPQRAWASLRTSLNLSEFFNGMVALTPPSHTQTLTGFTMLKTMLGARLGMSWDELAQGLGGHLLVGVKLNTLLSAKSQPNAVNGLIALSIDDVATADKVLDTLTALIAKRGGKRGKVGAKPGAKSGTAQRSPVVVAGHKGFRFQVASLPIFAVRTDHAILIAPSTAVIEAALKTAHASNLSQLNEGKMLDLESSFYGLSIDIMEAMNMLHHPIFKLGAKELASMKQLITQERLTKLKKNPLVACALRLDNGVTLTGNFDLGGVALLGILSAISIPAFLKYKRRAESSKATLNMRQLSSSALQYFFMDHRDAAGALMPQHFPPSAPMTPSDLKSAFCASGRHQRRVFPSSIWSHPTWKSLNFKPVGKLGFAYEFISSGVGKKAQFTIRAIGDQDCDGVFSIYELSGFTDAKGKLVVRPLLIENQGE